MISFAEAVYSKDEQNWRAATLGDQSVRNSTWSPTLSSRSVDVWFVCTSWCGIMSVTASRMPIVWAAIFSSSLSRAVSSSSLSRILALISLSQTIASASLSRSVASAYVRRTYPTALFQTNRPQTSGGFNYSKHRSCGRKITRWANSHSGARERELFYMPPECLQASSGSRVWYQLDDMHVGLCSPINCSWFQKSKWQCPLPWCQADRVQPVVQMLQACRRGHHWLSHRFRQEARCMMVVASATYPWCRWSRMPNVIFANGLVIHHHARQKWYIPRSMQTTVDRVCNLSAWGGVSAACVVNPHWGFDLDA